VNFFVDLAVALEAVEAASGDVTPVKVVVVGVPDGAFCIVAVGVGDGDWDGGHWRGKAVFIFRGESERGFNTRSL